ncbi:hypothetical protein BC940DRAFT_313400 [Gongronella butleri]|nr:hypothetical protein BC940DRAFT_313400 [Gongronella butleri]
MLTRPLLLGQSRRFLQTSTMVCADKGGVFSRFNPWAKQQQQQSDASDQPQSTEVVGNATFDVAFQDKETFASWKTNEIVSDDEQIQSIIQSIVIEHIPGTSQADYQQASLQNVDTKFKVVKDSIKQLGKEVPNASLHSISTVQDLISFFQQKPSLEATSVEQFFTQQAESLPSNLRFELSKTQQQLQQE